MQTPLVSVLTPCYNSGHLIHRLLESVLSQSYPNVEMVVIDDGSTDDSALAIKKYIPLFKKKGYTLRYYYQDNGGQSVAINNGLKIVNGSYLVWPDSDDYYSSPKAIELMVEFFITHPQAAIVRTMQRVVDEKDLRELYIQGDNAVEDGQNLFEDCLFTKNGFYWGAGAYMIRFSALKETCNSTIYTEKHAGQNWQLLLPILYTYPCYTLRVILYTIVACTDSHSRAGYKGYENILERINSYERTINETLERIITLPNEKIVYYKQQVATKYCKERMNLAYDYNQKDEFINEYNSLCIQASPDLCAIDRLRYYAIKIGFDFLLRFFLRLYHKITK